MTDYELYRYWMCQTLKLAQSAGEGGEVPIGAIVLDSNGEVIGRGENRRERDHDPSAHAEIMALRMAGQIKKTWKLTECTLYVNLEPCPMCAGAIVNSRIKLLVYGADDLKTGAVRTVLNIPDSAASNHKLQVIGGILESECSQVLKSWFMKKRMTIN